MDLDTFNGLPADQAADLVRPCADVTSWVRALVEDRPYASVADVLRHADELANTWGAVEVDTALAQHPRIGERRSTDDAEAAMSRSEQAGLSAAADEQAAIAAGNASYEERFGRIFLIRAAGRTSAEVLAQLTARLDNDPDTETGVVAGELREIALLRLEGIFAA